MAKIQILFLLFLFCASNAQSQHPWPPQGEQDKDFFINNRATPKPDGLHYRTYEDGKIYYSGMFLDGKPKSGGTFYYYFQDKEGALMSKHAFSDDIKIVDAENYYISSQLMSAGRYLNQKKEGKWKFWDPEGYLQSEIEFEDDVENGSSTTYFRNGNPAKTETFVNGAKHGPFKEFYKTTELKAKGQFLEGHLDGQIIQYHPNGVKMAVGTYEGGQKEGTWITFHSSGDIEMNILYKGGVQKKLKYVNGTFKENYPDGIPKSEYSYKEGKKHGPFKEWYDVGEWVREPMTESNPNIEAQFVEKLKGTVLSCEGDYMDDRLEGEVTYYDEKGRITKIEYYSGGELESSEER